MPPEIGLLYIDDDGRYSRRWEYPEKGLRGRTRYAGITGTIHFLHSEFSGKGIDTVEKTMPIGNRAKAIDTILNMKKFARIVEVVADGYPDMDGATS